MLTIISQVVLTLITGIVFYWLYSKIKSLQEVVTELKMQPSQQSQQEAYTGRQLSDRDIRGAEVRDIPMNNLERNPTSIKTLDAYPMNMA